MKKNLIKTLPLFILFTLLTFGFTNDVFSQTVLENIDEESFVSINLDELPVETIQRISPTKRIFVITNDNNSYDKGDFITMVYNEKRTARAVVAKLKDNVSGIRILKIYSLKNWNLLKKGENVKIIRGDDSIYTRRVEVTKEGEQISTEEDLYNETTMLQEDLSLEEKSNRAITTDNIICGTFGRIEGLDNTGSTASYDHFQGHWAYQVEDNIWLEASYGESIIRDYPALKIDTKMTNITAKAKYTIKAPLYSFLMPYVGYQIVSAASPGAGNGTTLTPTQQKEEIDKVERLKKQSVVFGITLLKRLVPGWFLRADLGSDIVNVGFGLEF